MKTQKWIYALLALALAMMACVDNVTGGLSVPVENVTAVASVDADSTGTNATWKFDFPDAGTASGTGWNIDGLPTSVDSGHVLVTTGKFKDTIGLGTQSWLAEPGTMLVGPDFPKGKMEAAKGAIEYISPITQKLIDEGGESFHLNEDRMDLCSFGAAMLEFNGVNATFEYSKGHSWFLIV